MKTINHGVMRSNNKRLILKYIHQNSPISKRAVAQQLGISITSVSTFIAELLKENLIISCGNAESTGGRKSELFQSNPEAFYVIGVDIQVDCLVALLLNAGGKIINKTIIPLLQSDEWQVATLLSETVETICNKTRIPLNKLVGLGIGIPGIVDRSTGLVEFAPNLNWKHVNLPVLLKTNQPVIIENEANAAVIGETSFGSAQGVGNVIYVSIGAGIGTGLILNHHLFEGKTYLAGEFGHMTVEASGIPCRCGNRGCWEAYASSEAALRLYRQYSGQALASYEDLLTLFCQKDPIALRVMEENLNYLALGIANLINGLNPEMIVLGGELTRINELVYPLLLKMVKDRAFEFSFKGTTVQFSTLDNHAAALGAGSLALNQHLATF